MVQGDYEEFKKAIFSLAKVNLSAYKEKQMRRRIDSLIEKRGCNNYPDYAKMLKSDKEAFNEFINFITINVSEFYRNPEEWNNLDKTYYPELIKKFGEKLKIWSAACSTGDEPYSLVMALSDLIPMKDVKIYATDIDKTVIGKAKVGLYNDKSIADIPEDKKKKYFTKIGDSFKISDEIKRQVEFHEANLLKDPYPRDCDLIVCRNVLIYFTEEAKKEVYIKFREAMKPGGILFIGSTEQVMDYKEIGLERRSSFFYQRV